MNIDNIIAACGVATIVVNAAGWALTMIIDGAQELHQIWRRRRHK